ncbi:hypothetical protein BZA70DRAFT_124471 [Myxozyma melibiosi]|uniref:Uncharacterized protein n=1 Tax=Myxozyma melibiosi TaxID=54550 RepID=A0ABR1F8H6_9ASCO
MSYLAVNYFVGPVLRLRYLGYLPASPPPSHQSLNSVAAKLPSPRLFVYFSPASSSASVDLPIFPLTTLLLGPSLARRYRWFHARLLVCPLALSSGSARRQALVLISVDIALHTLVALVYAVYSSIYLNPGLDAWCCSMRSGILSVARYRHHRKQRSL